MCVGEVCFLGCRIGRVYQMAVQPSEQQLKDAFALFDQTGDGTIATQQLGECLRVMGFAPTEKEIEDFIQSVGGPGSKIDYPTVKSMSARCSHVKRTHDELMVAFKGAFDRDGLGYLSTAELRQCLINLGEKLPDEEVDNFLGIAEVDDHGRSMYDVWIKSLETTSAFK